MYVSQVRTKNSPDDFGNATTCVRNRLRHSSMVCGFTFSKIDQRTRNWRHHGHQLRDLWVSLFLNSSSEIDRLAIKSVCNTAVGDIDCNKFFPEFRVQDGLLGTCFVMMLGPWVFHTLNTIQPNDLCTHFSGMEIVGTKWRAAITVLYQIPYSLGHMSLAGLAYYFRHWQHLQLAITLPSIILLSYWWIVPESPRWLLAVGKQRTACGILQKAAKCNGIEGKDIPDMVRKHCLQQVCYSFFCLLSLFHYPYIHLENM